LRGRIDQKKVVSTTDTVARTKIAIDVLLMLYIDRLSKESITPPSGNHQYFVMCNDRTRGIVTL
jgi:hypothetical protein